MMRGQGLSCSVLFLGGKELQIQGARPPGSVTVHATLICIKKSPTKHPYQETGRRQRGVRCLQVSPQHPKCSCPRLNTCFRAGENLPAKRLQRGVLPGVLGVPAGQPPPGAMSLLLPSSVLGVRYPPGKIRLSLLQTLRVSLPAGPEPGQSHPCERASGCFSSCTFTGVDPNHLSRSAVSPLFPSSPNQQQTVSPLVFYLADGVACAHLRMGREKQGRFLTGALLKWVLQRA